MYAPVRHQASGIVPEETEIIMKAIRIERTFRSRAQPHIVIHTGGSVAIRFNRKCRLAVLVSPDLDRTDPSDISGFQEISRLVPMRVATLPLAYLYDPVIFTGGFFHQVTFLDRIGERLLYIYVFSRLASPDRRKAMPMVRRTDNDYIYVFIIDYSSPVLI